MVWKSIRNSSMIFLKQLFRCSKLWTCARSCQYISLQTRIYVQKAAVTLEPETGSVSLGLSTWMLLDESKWLLVLYVYNKTPSSKVALFCQALDQGPAMQAVQTELASFPVWQISLSGYIWWGAEDLLGLTFVNPCYFTSLGHTVAPCSAIRAMLHKATYSTRG
jgi:hypothetical protein